MEQQVQNQIKPSPEHTGVNKSKLLVTMFLSAALTVGTTACGPNNDNRCYDANQDGYCDNDGGRTGTYIGTYYGKRYYGRTSTGISQGSSGSIKSGSGISSGSKGGIGSSSGSSSS
jgi:hypothetical protein